MDIKALRKKRRFSQSKMAEMIWITRLTYDSREKWKTEFKDNEMDKIREIFAWESEISEKVDKIISYHNTITLVDMENILETLQDYWLLNNEWIMVRSNMWNRFIKE